MVTERKSDDPAGPNMVDPTSARQKMTTFKSLLSHMTCRTENTRYVINAIVMMLA